MSKDLAQVIFRGGEAFSVNRASLAKNMQQNQRMAKVLGLRPGQSTGEGFRPNDNLSSDLISTTVTIFGETGILPK